MAEEKKYTVGVTQPKYWQTIHDMLADDSTENHIPNRKVTIFEEKEWSSTRGTFMLTDVEAEELKKHGFVKWVELDPVSYPELYPKGELYTQRWGKEPRHYRDLLDGQGPAGISTNEIDRTGWQIIRTGIKSCRSLPGIWQGSGQIPFVNADVDYSLTGKNVDVVIMDSGVMQYHPEFMKDGKSRVRDIVLDGPEVIDPDWFNSANATKYTKADGRVGIATTSAKEWWRFSNKRSAQFSSIGVINSTTFSTYTQSNSVGTGGTTNTIGGGHGTGAASVSCGKNFGLAFEANVWNAPAISSVSGLLSITTTYELLTIWHANKPINPETGVKNPTIVNSSWGYQACFTSGSTNIDYQFRGTTGTFASATDPTSDIYTAWKNGFNNQVQGAYKSWSTSSGSSSNDAAGDEMMLTGLHHVAAAGNNNQRLGIGSMDPDRLNYMENTGFNSGDQHGVFSGIQKPTNHRDWMNPQGLGFDEPNDWHPVICVGAMEDNIGICNGGAWCGGINGSYYEYQAAYSNNGPGITVWAPADECLSAGLSGDSSYEDFPRVDDGTTYTNNTTNGDYYDNSYNGTSSACPVTCGMLALYLEANPTSTQRQLQEWLYHKGSVLLDRSQFIDMYTDDTSNDYWSASWNLRGGEGRVIYNPYANAGITSVNLGAGGKVSGPLTIKGLWS